MRLYALHRIYKKEIQSKIGNRYRVFENIDDVIRDSYRVSGMNKVNVLLIRGTVS